MLIGPILTRELATAPLRARFYQWPALYLGAQLLLLFAAWLLLAGTQELRHASDLARFGMTIFPILAVLQLAMSIFFAAIFAAGSIAQEKDRRTLVLLLMTRLNNSELVLGRLFASLLPLAMSWLATIPLFLLLRGLGGISLSQITLTLAITAVTMYAAGSLGSLVAYWREKTFLILALTTLILVAWLGFWTAVELGMFGPTWFGKSTQQWAALSSPISALWQALAPLPQNSPGPLGITHQVGEYLLFAIVLGTVLNCWAILMLRVWNPSREVAPRWEDEHVTQNNIHAAPGRARHVWDNPILWREVATWAYGKRILLVRAAYLILMAVGVITLWKIGADSSKARETLALILAPLFVLSLILTNALAVNSITNERDLGALDLLLVTDLTPKEFIYGKLLGIWYGAKEMVGLPLLLIGALWWTGWLRGEVTCYLIIGLTVLQAYVSMLGVHVGLAYENSRQAIAVSLGIVFFLLVGVGTCMRIMIAFSNSSLSVQLIAFSAVIFCGSLVLYVALSVRNPSGAIALASITGPVLTFVAIMNFLSGESLSVFLVCVVTYGFATIAMLIPAIDEFDIATGRSTE